jgi:putative DNA primase/helicase
MLLGCPNGCLDLRTGTLRAQRREDYLTKLTRASYRPEATCPTWLAFLDRVMAGDQEMIAFLQRAAGYALTGDTGEEVLFFLYGLGRNGKTKLSEGLSDPVGDYAQAVAFDTFLAKKTDAIPNDVARMRGARLVTASEPDEGRTLNEALVKRMTGGDTIAARYLYREFFDYRPTCKVFLAGNHKPAVRGTDEGIWSRVMLLPFTVTIPPEERDRHLLAKLQRERDGILAWAVAGCLAWQREGLQPPETVQAATAQYRMDEDIVGQFIAAACVVHPRAWAGATPLYEAFKDFLGGSDAISVRAFGRRLSEKGFAKRHERSGTVYAGVGLRADAPDGPARGANTAPTRPPVTDVTDVTPFHPKVPLTRAGGTFSESDTTSVTSVTASPPTASVNGAPTPEAAPGPAAPAPRPSRGALLADAARIALDPLDEGLVQHGQP